MGLKDGNLGSLIKYGANMCSLAERVFKHMLEALDFLALNGVIHRDLKPENILYTSLPGGEYQFQLGDFGFSHMAVDARTYVGSHLYMAPEIFAGGEQTHKVDIWSLFVTILWVLDAGGFRSRSGQFKHPYNVQMEVLSVASNLDMVSHIREMACPDPNERPSAAQMLVKCFNGEGLSTDPSQSSPPLINSAPESTLPETLNPLAFNTQLMPIGPTCAYRAQASHLENSLYALRTRPGYP
jgi:serine/threonine protein kinase